MLDMITENPIVFRRMHNKNDIFFFLSAKNPEGI